MINEESMTPPVKSMANRPRIEIMDPRKLSVPTIFQRSPISDPEIYSHVEKIVENISLDSVVTPPASPNNGKSKDYPYSYIEQGTLEAPLKPGQFLSAPRRQRSSQHGRGSDGSIEYRRRTLDDHQRHKGIHSLQGEYFDYDKLGKRSRNTIARIPKDFQKVSCPTICNDPQGFEHFRFSDKRDEGQSDPWARYTKGSPLSNQRQNFKSCDDYKNHSKIRREAADHLPKLIIMDNDRDSGWEDEGVRSPNHKTHKIKYSNWGGTVDESAPYQAPRPRKESDDTIPQTSDSDGYSMETLNTLRDQKSPENEYYTLERTAASEPEEYQTIQMMASVEFAPPMISPDALDDDKVPVPKMTESSRNVYKLRQQNPQANQSPSLGRVRMGVSSIGKSRSTKLMDDDLNS